MEERRYVIKLSDFQRRIMINGLNEYLTVLADREMPADDVCDILSMLMSAQPEKRRGMFRANG